MSRRNVFAFCLISVFYCILVMLRFQQIYFIGPKLPSGNQNKLIEVSHLDDVVCIRLRGLFFFYAGGTTYHSQLDLLSG